MGCDRFVGGCFDMFSVYILYVRVCEADDGVIVVYQLCIWNGGRDRRTKEQKEKRTEGEKNGRTEGEKDKRTEEQKSGKGRGFG